MHEREKRTDCNDTETHCDCVLNSKVTKTSTSTGKDNPVTDVCLAVLDGTVYSDTLNVNIKMSVL